jgi:hypothetical protein
LAKLLFGVLLKHDQKDLTFVQDLLDKLRMTIENVPLMLNDEIIKPGAFIYELLKEVGIDSATIGFLQQGIDAAMHILAGMCSYHTLTFLLYLKLTSLK